MLAFLAAAAGAQDRCMTPDEAARVAATVTKPVQAADIKGVRKELVNMLKEHNKLYELIFSDFQKNEARVPELNTLGAKHMLRVCEILKQNGWQNKEMLKDEALNALVELVANNRAVLLQREMFPVLIAASKTGDVRKVVVATMADTIRIGLGLPQIFGTQATRRGDVIYILPLLNSEKVDDWRKEYEMKPLASSIRGLEAQYLLPVMKDQRLAGQQAKAKKAADIAALGIEDDGGDLKIETQIVNLNLRVFDKESRTPARVTLAKEDLVVVEDGVEQEIEFFSGETAPFDLILLMDFSGSTSEKTGLMKRAAKRFVELTRPDDRVAVATFSESVSIVSAITPDKDALAKAIDKIKSGDGSAVWDSLEYAYKNVLPKDSGRRTAVVFMTDADDNSSKTTFADVLEVIRNSDATVFPVYVNSFGIDPNAKSNWGRFGAKLQSSLEILAEETGGQVYEAKDLRKLNSIYEQIIKDIGETYSIGYAPKNEDRDGGWRSVTVKVKGRPSLVARTRRGYYAK